MYIFILVTYILSIDPRVKPYAIRICYTLRAARSAAMVQVKARTPDGNLLALYPSRRTRKGKPLDPIRKTKAGLGKRNRLYYRGVRYIMYIQPFSSI